MKDPICIFLFSFLQHLKNDEDMERQVKHRYIVVQIHTGEINETFKISI